MGFFLLSLQLLRDRLILINLFVNILKLYCYEEGCFFCCSDIIYEYVLQENKIRKIFLKKGLHFWINNESFDTNAKSLTIDTLSRNYDATATAERHIIFSWNHYYNDINNPEFTQLNSEFKNFNSQYISGDVNADGEFNIADVVTLQKWLIDESDTKLKNCKSADVSADGQIDVIDLVILKNMILNV